MRPSSRLLLNRSLFGSLTLGLITLANQAAASVNSVLLLREGSPTSSGLVRSIHSVSANSSGQWAASVALDGNPDIRAFVGLAASSTNAPDVLLQVNTAPAMLRQVAFKSAFFMHPSGRIVSSSTVFAGACIPMASPSKGFSDSLWVDDQARTLEWRTASGKTAWRSLLPIGLTGDTNFAWIGGLGSRDEMMPFSNGLFIGNLNGTFVRPVLTRLSEIPGLPTSTPIDPERPVILAHVAPDEESFIASIRLKGPERRNEVIVKGTRNGDNFMITPHFGTSMIRKGSAVSGTNAPSATWLSFNRVGVGSTAESKYWFVSGTAAPMEGPPISLILQGSEGQSVRQSVLLKSNDVLNGTSITGPFSHVAMNRDGDIAVACSISILGTRQRALVVNRRIVLRQGDDLPLGVASNGTTIYGDMTNILGQHNMVLSDRAANGSLTVFVVANVEPRETSSDPGVTPDGRIQALYKIVVPKILVAGCAADFDSDGHVTVSDIFTFLAAWFAGNPSADVNGSGNVAVNDIFEFLALWFSGCS